MRAYLVAAALLAVYVVVLSVQTLRADYARGFSDGATLFGQVVEQRVWLTPYP